MAKYIKLDVGQPEASIKKTELVLNKMMNRMHKSVGVHIPPMPISMYVETTAGKTLLQYMCSIPGKLSLFGVQVDQLPEGAKNVDMELRVITGKNMSKFHISGRNTYNSIDPNIDLAVGTKVILELVNSEDEVTGVWINGLVNIKPKTVQLHKMIVDQLEELNESIAKDLGSGEGVETPEDN